MKLPLWKDEPQPLSSIQNLSDRLSDLKGCRHSSITQVVTIEFVPAHRRRLVFTQTNSKTEPYGSSHQQAFGREIPEKRFPKGVPTGSSPRRGSLREFSEGISRGEFPRGDSLKVCFRGKSCATRSQISNSFLVRAELRGAEAAGVLNSFPAGQIWPDASFYGLCFGVLSTWECDLQLKGQIDCWILNWRGGSSKKSLALSTQRAELQSRETHDLSIS